MKILAFLALLSLGVEAAAMPPHETFVYLGLPSTDRIAIWSSFPGTRSYLFQTQNPDPSDLLPLAHLHGADRIRIEISTFPDANAVSAWKALAGQGVELVGLNAGAPTDEELDHINQIGFSSCVFVLNSYLTPDEATRLARLKMPFSLTFDVDAYPLYMSKPTFVALPASTSLLFATDYWPGYTHMDLFNLISQTIRIRVSGSLPSSENLSYLLNIHRLDEVNVMTDFDVPAAASWRAFGKVPVLWSMEGAVPSSEAIQAFEQGPGPRGLVIDSDTPLTDDESSRLTRAAIPVEWIHQAP